jgi:hypothetical protein
VSSNNNIKSQFGVVFNAPCSSLTVLINVTN